MENLNSVLAAHKLTGPQRNAVVELMLDDDFTTAKPNTIKSLENKGLIGQQGDKWVFGYEFAAQLKSTGGETGTAGKPDFQQESVGQFLREVEENIQETSYEVDAEDVAAMVQASNQFAKFHSMWDDIFKITAGFGATLDWRGAEVWDGLTAAEIKEDMETATPINRQARRTHFRTLRNAFRRVTVERPRKQLKITGKVGV